jgi:hypothetical protein
MADNIIDRMISVEPFYRHLLFLRQERRAIGQVMGAVGLILEYYGTF